MTAPKPGGLYALRPVLSNDTMLGRETVTSMQRRVSASATVAGVNGDLFTWNEGLPSGMLMQSGVLDDAAASAAVERRHHRRRTRCSWSASRCSAPGRARASAGRSPASTSARARTASRSSRRPGAPRRPPRGHGRGRARAVPAGGAEHRADRDRRRGVKPAGGTPIPRGGAVLVGRGTSAGRLAAEAPVGQTVTVRLILQPAVGRGRRRDRRRPGDRPGRQAGLPGARGVLEQPALAPQSAHRASASARTARIVLVAVDGRQPGYSAGMTNFELAQTMVRLGAVTARGARRAAARRRWRSTGSCSTARRTRRRARRGRRADRLLLRRPRAAAARARALAERRRRRRDAVAGYKVVRPSTVTASLVGPDRVPRQTQTGPREPGHLPARLERPHAPRAAPEPEGRWRWVVNAVDDPAQQSTAERVFSLNNTLGYLRRRPRRRRRPPPRRQRCASASGSRTRRS